jgi:hypothetical protein
MKGQLKNNPEIYQKLVQAGWSPTQIPGWVAKPPEGTLKTLARTLEGHPETLNTLRNPAERLKIPEKLGNTLPIGNGRQENGSGRV